ncbi:MAG: peptidase [Tardiphaga sp.]|nr:peptidase [Tardiphaga sp.]
MISPDPARIPDPQDRPYPGIVKLHVDATDVTRCIFQVRQTIPVAKTGAMTLLYPKWIPGFHSPAAAIELLAGVEIRAGEHRLNWQRHPVEVHAFECVVPEGAAALDIRFQFLSPTSGSQGTICMTPAMLAARWGAMVLYPAGYFSRQIQVAASIDLPEGWQSASALAIASAEGTRTIYRPVSLDVLVDSPVLAGDSLRRVRLDDQVHLNLVADRSDSLELTEQQIEAHRAVIREADALFGSRHFDRYEFLVAVSDEIGGGGVEHQRSCEIVVPANYFTAWDSNAPKRDVFAHEYVHSWNGKFRRGADSWTPSFERPIRNSLMWVYEGQTQYWGEVLAARSGLWKPQQALDTLAATAAIYDNRPGGRWRTLSDTTRDPILAGRQPLPWASWQRSEDYYSEGQLLWLAVDTLIRKQSDDRRSLDDFAKRFFGNEDGRTTTSIYEFADVVDVLASVQDYDWAAFLTERLESRTVGAPLEGLQHGGYRLVYRGVKNDFAIATEAVSGIDNFRFSIGMAVSSDGTLQEVIWDGPAFQAGLVAGAKLLAVNDRAYDADSLRRAVTNAQQTGEIQLTVQRGKRLSTLVIKYAGGHRYPHLEPIEGARRRLDEILAPSVV